MQRCNKIIYLLFSLTLLFIKISIDKYLLVNLLTNEV